MKTATSIAVGVISALSASAHPFGDAATAYVEARTERTSEFNASVPRWEWYPAAQALTGEPEGSYLNTSSGVQIWYAELGQEDSDKTPVLVLHGGTGNSNQMFNQVNALAKTRKVIVQDTRGEARSPYEGFTDFHYDDFARDAIELMDHLSISKAAIFGWSDGAITGLDMAMNYTSRVDRVFAHGANAQFDPTKPGLKDPIINSETGSFESDVANGGVTYSVNGDGLSRRKREDDPYSYANLSPTPERQEEMETAVYAMWTSEPAWGPEAFKKIECPVWIVDGDHDAGIARNQADAMAAWIPYAGQVFIPQTGHFAHMEDPTVFTFLLTAFLDQEYEGQLPVY